MKRELSRQAHRNSELEAESTSSNCRGNLGISKASHCFWPSDFEWVADLSKLRQTRHVQADLPEEGCPVHRVEGVATVNFQNNVGNVARSAGEPTAGPCARRFHNPQRQQQPRLRGAPGPSVPPPCTLGKLRLPTGQWKVSQQR